MSQMYKYRDHGFSVENLGTRLFWTNLEMLSPMDSGPGDRNLTGYLLTGPQPRGGGRSRIFN